MPTEVKPDRPTLTDANLRNAKPGQKFIGRRNGQPVYETVSGPYRLTVGNGLYLEVRENGSKLWRYRYRIAGKENLFAIGEYFADKRPGHVSLDDARAARDKARVLVKQGVHPAHHRKAERQENRANAANSFRAVATEWVEQKKPRWTASYCAQVERLLELDLFPDIGSMPIRNIKAAQLLDILRRIEARGAVSLAFQARQCASAVFRYGVATLRADHDPAGALKGAIHRGKIKHRVALSRGQIAELLKALNSYSGERTTVLALRLLLLTFVRPVELRGARWAEIDFDRAEWRIPAERMKMKEMHIVPLAPQAVELLRELHTLSGEREFLFPNRTKPRGHMSSATLNWALKTLGFNGEGSIGFSAHGFRATASTILNELGFRPDVIERQLAHAERNNVRRSYNHAQYMQERRDMMNQWADLVGDTARGGNVTPIRNAA